MCRHDVASVTRRKAFHLKLDALRTMHPTGTSRHAFGGRQAVYLRRWAGVFRRVPRASIGEYEEWGESACNAENARL